MSENAKVIGSIGGHARAAALSPEERSAIASTAARARWGKDQTIRVKNYGCEELNRLAAAAHAIDAMEPNARLRAFEWFKGKYSKEWPSSSY